MKFIALTRYTVNRVAPRFQLFSIKGTGDTGPVNFELMQQDPVNFVRLGTGQNLPREMADRPIIDQLLSLAPY